MIVEATSGKRNNKGEDAITFLPDSYLPTQASMSSGSVCALLPPPAPHSFHSLSPHPSLFSLFPSSLLLSLSYIHSPPLTPLCSLTSSILLSFPPRPPPPLAPPCFVQFKILMFRFLIVEDAAENEGKSLDSSKLGQCFSTTVAELESSIKYFFIFFVSSSLFFFFNLCIFYFLFL